MSDPQRHVTGLRLGVQARPESVARMRPTRPLIFVVLLRLAVVYVVIFEFSAHFLFNEASRPTAPLVVKSEAEDSPARKNMAISPVVGDKYPSLRRHRQAYAGKSDAAVLDSFSHSTPPAEKTKLAGELDASFRARNSGVAAGPYDRSDDITPREVHEPSDLAASPQVDVGTLVVASIADAEIPEPAPAPEADPIAEEPTAANRVSDRPALPPGFPVYEILFQTDDPLGRRVYAEVLVPALSPQTPKRDRRRVSRTIAELEGIDDLTLYCTRQAREAHYSMDYSDAHPNALAQGLLGSLERGRFKAYNPR
ncbi:MAG: hypothetical protein IIA66_10980 [Planctomycetes bacterium]|nr:hypothetical protein [Planctomycetota bacterium]